MSTRINFEDKIVPQCNNPNVNSGHNQNIQNQSYCQIKSLGTVNIRRHEMERHDGRPVNPKGHP